LSAEPELLSNYFEIVKKNINYKYSSQGEDTGNIPFIATKKLNRGIAKYVDKEEYEGDVLTVCNQRNSTAGYTFHHKGKIAWESITIFVIKLKNGVNLNLDINAKLLTLQLCPNHLNDERLISNFLDEKYVYLYK